ncbi:competence protein ComEC [Rhodopseudomonas julia]|uniref:Competence protein ComEC n=1 Tax=Rhodopseudomonas julia TaxID=200617 RepID=A0ABU0C9V5_9BRAD|nr:ComEC/Rec2 family competence protein [Rhodopseudomonas julia]MDQ0327301.1 competence protein ComEC [Rhodopseudomonas julia]
MEPSGGQSSAADGERPSQDGRRIEGFLPPGRLTRFGYGLASHAAHLRDQVAHDFEERRGFLFLAVGFSCGAATYFILPREPLLSALLLATGTAVFAAFLAWRRGGGAYPLVLVACFLAGMSAGKLRVESLRAPMVEHPLSGQLTGRVVAVETRAERTPRVVLDQVSIERLPAEETPHKIRLTLRTDLPPLGARVEGSARLAPLPGPAMPGGYDPARAAFFDGIGASGFVFGALTVVEPVSGVHVFVAIAAIRRAIAQRITDAVAGPAAAIAAALLVGDRGQIADADVDALRIAGLAHILAISGLHMMLIAGTAFWLMRAVLALSEHAALVLPIRKIAAAIALAVGAFYLSISGGNVATIRAFVMIAVMLTAVFLDRPALSLRNLAIAAFVVVALQPESVLEPGFQMSFLAVAALVAAWEAWRDRPRHDLAEPARGLARLLRRPIVAIGTVGLTTLVAGLATSPFAAFHFGRLASYSLLGNLIAMPLVSLLVMPAGLISLIAMPFGLEVLPLTVMAWGIDLVLASAHFVASLPGATVLVPPFPAIALMLMSGGILWLSLWRSQLRLYGIAPLLVGTFLAWLLGAEPDVLVDEAGRAVAARDVSGHLHVVGARQGSFLHDVWREGEPEDDPAGAPGFRCDDEACVLEMPEGLTLSRVTDPVAFSEDCHRAEIIVTQLRAPADCAARFVIDRSALAAHGAHALFIAHRGPDRATPHLELRMSRPSIRRPWHGPPALR